MEEWTQEIEGKLLKRSATGDRKAFAVLYDRYASPLYSLAFRMLGNRNDAEEIVQDIFVTLWSKAGTFDPEKAKLFTWLTAMTRNRCIDRLRARNARIATSENRAQAADTFQPEVSADDRSAPDSLIQKEEVRHLTRALRALPLEQRQALELAFFQGLTHREIAEQQMLSLGTVKARIRYGLEKLRTRYAAE
jgi:RNA polymerase sigma-70 factor (ECF subfamily)